MFWHSLILFRNFTCYHGKSNSGGSVDSGSSPPRVHQTGGPKFRLNCVQLDSGEFGAVGTPAFNTKMHELAVLFARMSQLCQRLGLPVPGSFASTTFLQTLSGLVSAKLITVFVQRGVLVF